MSRGSRDLGPPCRNHPEVRIEHRRTGRSGTLDSAERRPARCEDRRRGRLRIASLRPDGGGRGQGPSRPATRILEEVRRHPADARSGKNWTRSFVETTAHTRVWCMMHALAAGCDVYGEKPLTLTIAEGRIIADAVKKFGRFLQTGTQQRSMPINAHCSKLFRDGAIGKVKEAIVYNLEGGAVNPRSGGDRSGNLTAARQSGRPVWHCSHPSDLARQTAGRGVRHRSGPFFRGNCSTHRNQENFVDVNVIGPDKTERIQSELGEDYDHQTLCIRLLFLMGCSGSAQDTRMADTTIDPVEDKDVELTLVQEGRRIKLYRGGFYRVNEQSGRWDFVLRLRSRLSTERTTWNRTARSSANTITESFIASDRSFRMILKTLGLFAI